MMLSRSIVLGLLTGTLAACGGGGSSRDACEGLTSGQACTWAGVKELRGYNGEGLARTESWLFFVEDLTFAPDGRPWVSDWNNHRIRRVELDGTFSTVVGTDYEGDGPPGEIDRLPAGAPEGAPATTIALNHPTDVEFLPDGTMVFAAWHNNKIRHMDANGIVKVLGGDGYGFQGDEGPAYAAVFNQPKALAIDEDGNIYTNDQRNQRIRKIDAGSPRMITTVAGNGMSGYAGDGGFAADAMFNWDMGTTPLPSGALAYRDGMLYIADTLNNRIRTLDLATGAMECIGGTGAEGSSGDGGPALSATFKQPLDLEFGPDGRLYVADTFNNAIRAIDLETGMIERVVGNGRQCAASLNCYEAEDVVAAADVQLLFPYGIAFDAEGSLYVADTHNSRIVKVAR